MEITDTVAIRGDLERIYELASKTNDWPRVLPHYRDVTTLSAEGESSIVRMHCVRSFGLFNWPCKWTARQTNRPDVHRILFDHIAGPTRGMKVEWRLSQRPEGGVEATIWHELKSRIPFFGWIYTDLIIGPIFIHAVAGRTLRTIKAIVEKDPGRTASTGTERTVEVAQ